MRDLSSDTFVGLSKTDTFGIYTSTVKHVEKEAFQPLENLIKLYIHDCTINLISGMFNFNTILRALQIKNSIGLLPEKIFWNLNIIELHLVNNKLKEISENLFNGTYYITDLDFSYNQIEFLSGNLFAHLLEFKNLNLSSNRLKKLPTRKRNGLLT